MVIYKKTDNNVERKVAGELILVPISSNAADLENIYTLNEAGARIWELIDGKNSADKIKEITAQEFEVEEKELAIDIEAFLSQLKKMDMIS